MRGARVCRRCLRRVEPGRPLASDDQRTEFVRLPQGQPIPEGAYVRSIINYVFEPYDPAEWIRPPIEVFLRHECAAGAAGSQDPDGAPGA